jgi:hypothetical protein
MLDWFVLGRTHGHDVISNLDIGDALSNRLDNSSSLVAEDGREHSLRVVTGKLIEW